MKRKLCGLCHKNPIAFITRKDKDSKKLYICKPCAFYFKGELLVSYNKGD